MNNRSLFALVSAFLLLGLVCACVSVGAAVFAVRQETTTASVPAVLDERAVEVPSRAPGTPAPESVAPNTQQDTTDVPETAPLDLPDDALAIVRAEEEVLNRVYVQVSPSVVNISVSGAENSVFGEQGEGSGFVWDQEGHIVTNNHVVAGAETILVTFSDTTQVSAEIVGRDEGSDLAVIRVDVDPALLRPVPIGESGALRVGQRVIAIGNPFGFDRTLTLGVVSAVGRTVPGEIGEDGFGRFSLPNLVQTDAAINPGNSGGPLLDIEGNVVGVNTLIYSTLIRANSGVGFAVPVDKVREVIPALIADGEYRAPYLGITTALSDVVLTPDLAALLELENVDGGVLVDTVVEGGPSDQAGVRGSTRRVEVPSLGGSVRTGGDVIIAIDDQPVRGFDDVVNYLDTRRVGDVVTLTVIRDGQEMRIDVTLGPRP